MRLFGRKPERETARPALTRSLAGMIGVGAAMGEWPRGYEVQLREAMALNPVAQRAARLVAETCAGAPLYAAPDEIAAQHDVLALVTTASGGQSLIETAALHLLLNGNAYIQIVCDAEGEPAELYALRPERVTVEPDANGWPAAYRYKAGDSVARIAAIDGAARPGLVHIRAPNPVDDHYGLGCLGAAAGAVAIHNAATRWNKALLDNAARPSGALVYDPGDPGATLSPDQFDRLRAEMEASFAGTANAGRPMLLEGGLRWQAMSLTPADMDFVGLKAAAAREIALAFGVPPMILGLPGDNTAELRGPTALLERPAVEQTSPECRADLGDKRCRIDMAGRTRIATVTAVSGATLTLSAAEPSANAYGYGRLRWISGANSGLASAILSSSGSVVTLREPSHFTVAAGTLVELSEGCDRRFETCVARFANAVNFRGEPHLPGNDLLTRYPGA